MMKEVIGYLYNQKKIERKGFVSSAKMRWFLNSKKSNGPSWETFDFKKIKETFEEKEKPNIQQGKNYKIINEKVKIIPINIKIFTCNKIKVVVNKENVSWSGKDKKYGVITEKKIEKEQVNFFLTQQGAQYDTAIIRQRINIGEVEEKKNLKLLKELEYKLNEKNYYRNSTEKEIYTNNLKAYNTPEEIWEELWEHLFYDFREDVITSEVIGRGNIVGEKKNIYNCKNGVFDYSTPKEFYDFSIVRAKGIVDCSKIRIENLYIYNSKIEKIKLNKKTKEIILRNTTISNIKELTQMKGINIKEIKNETFPNLKADCIDITKVDNCKFGDLETYNPEGEIYFEKTNNIEIGDITTNCLYFDSGIIEKIGKIKCGKISFFSSVQPNGILTIPNEINIDFLNETDKNSYVLDLNYIKVLDEKKPLIINVKNLHEIIFYYEAKIPKKIIINISNIVDTFGKSAEKEEKPKNYLSMLMFENQQLLTSWYTYMIPKKKKYLIPKKWQGEQRMLFDINKYLKEKNIEINYKGRKLTEKEIFNSFYET